MGMVLSSVKIRRQRLSAMLVTRFLAVLVGGGGGRPSGGRPQSGRGGGGGSRDGGRGGGGRQYKKTDFERYR